MINLTEDRWQHATSRERAELATALARELPTGFSFGRVRSVTFAGRSREVAEYDFASATFVLVPGGEVRLGYDHRRVWGPTPTERESWRETAGEYELGGGIHEHVASVTQRPRTAELKPFLIERSASGLGAQPVTETRARAVKQPPPPTHGKLAADLAAAGLRFPTSDEWEYACGAGAETLFRWGDHAPCDRYPIDTRPIAASSDDFGPDWALHRAPNAFGILIASDPYLSELTADADTTRGGDGGGLICGGAGFFVGWLTLATAYFEPSACRRDPAAPIDAGYTIGRRVLELA